MVYHIGLFIHIAGIMMIGGGSIGAILAEKQLWKKVRGNSENAKELVPVLQSATSFILIGMVMFLVSGLIMLNSVNWILLSNPWFISKLMCFVLLPLRGAFVGKPTVAHIDKQLQTDNYDVAALMKLRSKLTRFHITQFILVGAIVFLIIFMV